MEIRLRNYTVYLTEKGCASTVATYLRSCATENGIGAYSLQLVRVFDKFKSKYNSVNNVILNST